MESKIESMDRRQNKTNKKKNKLNKAKNKLTTEYKQLRTELKKCQDLLEQSQKKVSTLNLELATKISLAEFDETNDANQKIKCISCDFNARN